MILDPEERVDLMAPPAQEENLAQSAPSVCPAVLVSPDPPAPPVRRESRERRASWEDLGETDCPAPRVCLEDLDQLDPPGSLGTRVTWVSKVEEETREHEVTQVPAARPAPLDPSADQDLQVTMESPDPEASRVTLDRRVTTVLVVSPDHPVPSVCRACLVPRVSRATKEIPVLWAHLVQKVQEETQAHLVLMVPKARPESVDSPADLERRENLVTPASLVCLVMLVVLEPRETLALRVRMVRLACLVLLANLDPEERTAPREILVLLVHLVTLVLLESLDPLVKTESLE